MSVVDVRGLRMRYGSVDVLDDVNFQVGAGEVVAILGPNGAGKTTTLEILEGFRRRSAGEIAVLGTDPATAGETWRARTGVVLQSWRDHGRWGVAELLRHLGSLYLPFATAERARPRDIDELIAAVGLTGRRDAKIRTLSGGERRRLDLAIGIIGRPDLLFLDEPTAGLDPQARRALRELLHEVVDRDDTTIVMTTHDLDEAAHLADRILILDRGRIVADGSPDQLAKRMSGRAEVRWSIAGDKFVHTGTDPTAFVRELFAQHGAHVADLEVRRASLEDAYMAIVQRQESGMATAPLVALEEAPA
ncbi:MAG TPA: ABC transporter ATP-binding protein [Micromonosporaceae bacterium]|nr:ABC transporter ATP-binding protein [Micromonosporaceae bacterium]